MSSGVSEKNIDQMKIPGNSAKNGEERNVPWSQQVDEASYEDLASSISEDISAAHQNLMQFQYPPFHIKDNAKLPWKNFKSRKTPNNFDANKKHGKSSFYNVNKRDDNKQGSSWFGNSARKTHSDIVSDNVKRPIKFEEDPSSKANIHPHNPDILEDKRSNDVSVTTTPKKTTWASIASQPAKLTSRTTMTTTSHKKKGPGMPPPPMVPGRHNFDVNTWDMPNNNLAPVPSPPSPVDLGEIPSDFPINTYSEQETSGGRFDKGQKGGEFQKTEKSNYNNINYGRSKYSPNGHSRNQPSSIHLNRHSGNASIGFTRRNENNNTNSSRSSERKISYGEHHPDSSSNAIENRDTSEITSITSAIALTTPQEVLDKLLDKNNYNPTEIDMQKASTARFFVIKSYSEDDIHRSIKYEIWCSTDHGNKRLDDAFKERHKKGGNILLFFSVNGSGHFCGMAQMMTEVDYNSTSSVWSQDKWKGKFKVKWIYVKDVPNFQFRHIRLENNDNKSVTNSRDTQEVPNAKGIQVLQILHTYKHKTSLFDDFYHYEKRQEEEVSSKKPFPQDNAVASQVQSPNSRYYNRQHDSGSQKQIGSAGMMNSRDRNNSHRSNYNDYRRFDTHRSVNMEYQQKDKNVNSDRENSEYSGRYSRKNDYPRRDDLKQNWDKAGGRLRTDSKDFHKDNENVERLRSTDY